MDAWLLDFMKENLVTLGLALAILKAIAKATPWAVDDEILQILTGFWGGKDEHPDICYHTPAEAC